MSRTAAPAPARRLCLRVERDGTSSRFVLEEGENTIGSGPGNTLVLRHSAVSRRHAVVRAAADGVEVEDLGSKNGTHLNGRRVRRSLLGEGDSLRLGPIHLKLESVDGEDVTLAIALDPVGRPSPIDTSDKTTTTGTGSDAGGGRSARRIASSLHLPDGHVRGGSERMVALYTRLRQLASGDIPVLITGETGVGKEHVARILHDSSRRKDGPFQAINCAAVPAELLEAELFGVERGAATGVLQRPGQFQLADGGVLFLDEISEMPHHLQAKLLRALQLLEVQPVGARKPLKVDVRVIAATNAEPKKLVGEGKLRQDLYYRIAACTVNVPPLRDRKDDIAVLVEQFVRRFAAEGGKRVQGISSKALRILVSHPWPGNVRQLEHEVRRLVHACTDGGTIDSTLLGELEKEAAGAADGPGTLAGETDLRIHPRVDAIERQLIQEALARTGGHRTKAAELLGITRDGLRLKMERLGIKKGSPAHDPF